MLIGRTDVIAGKPAPTFFPGECQVSAHWVYRRYRRPAPTYLAVIARARQVLPALAALLLSFPALFLWAQLPIGRCRGCTFSNLYRS